MKIKFEANQQYQLDAIQAAVDIFDGQPLASGDFEIRFDTAGGELFKSLARAVHEVSDYSPPPAGIRTGGIPAGR